MGLLIFKTLIFGLTLWMGLYVLVRNGTKPAMRYAGMGLVSYAIGLALATLLDEGTPYIRWVALAPLIFWVLAVRQLYIYRPDRPGNRHWVWLAIAATVFFGLGLGLLFLPMQLLSLDWVLLAISVDLLLLGYAIAQLDAADEGEALLPDALRSLLATSLAGLVLGGQAVLVMVIEDNQSAGMQLLLITLVTTAIGLVVLAGPLRRLMDEVVFQRNPELLAQRATLQATADALPRARPAHDFSQMDEEEFTRLTRRAISYIGRLDRLVSSPLMQLPLIDRQLGQIDTATSLERAGILKNLLTEGIERLRPQTDEGVGTSEEWRYYNALYYPYVQGLKPLSLRLVISELDADTRLVVEWFRQQVPERTLHNWQNAGAALVAQHLREQL